MLSSWMVSAPEVLASCGRQLAYATMMFLVVVVLLRLLPRVSPTLRYALWGLVLLRLVLPPDLSAPWGLSNLMSSPANEGTALATSFAGQASVHPMVEVGGEDTLSGGLQARHVLALWLLGTLVALLHLARRRRAHARQLETPVQHPKVLARLAWWRSRLGIHRSVRLFSGEAAASPFTLGSFRPRIFVPRMLLDPEQGDTLDAVLAHELVHVKRWDDLALVGERLLVCLYFFFPPARWAAARRSVEREALCDQAVVASGIAPKAYAQALLYVARLNLGGDLTVATFTQPRSTLTMRNTLTMRFRAIVDSPAQRPSAGPATTAALLLGVLLLPMAAVPNSLAVSDPPTSEPTAKPLALTHPTFLHPLPEARLTAPFGPWKHPIEKENVHHNGIDLAADEGREIVAPSDGTVTRARLTSTNDDGYGTLLEIDHGGGLTTAYYHLGELRTEAGQHVTRGQVIATVGMTGRTTGPHLHFEVRQDGELVDPQELLRQ